MLVPNLYGISWSPWCAASPADPLSRPAGTTAASVRSSRRPPGNRKLPGGQEPRRFFAAVDMLKHFGLRDRAYLIKDAGEKTLNEDRVHPGPGGMATTRDLLARAAEVSRHTTVPLDNRPHFEEAQRTHA
ncbi:hypothetical protein HPB49_015130 [Dermacentor silvarum]|uniref:Uncharacterized protein n=1 Tax=Dermacentor silvarum TaxID=543639 RepID=A0ACB8E177_DERSI|nr:hypothetical protein HPB49_015130 [Dermacentor silvarum]